MAKLETSKAKKRSNFDLPWEELMDNEDFVNMFLSEVLEDYIQKQRWYGGKSSKLKYIELTEYFRIQRDEEMYYGLILEVNFEEAFYQHYFIPIAFVTDEDYATNDRILPICIQETEGYIIDAINLEAFRKVVFERILSAQPHDTGHVQYHKSESFKETEYKSSRNMGMEQSNTSVIINDTCVIKFFRRIYANKNPDYEMSLFLSEKKGFKNTPAYQGSLNIIDSDNLYITIALMQEMVDNKGDAWEYMLQKLDVIFQNLSDKNIEIDRLPSTELFVRLPIKDVPHEIIDWAGLDIFQKMQKLAQRTAEMHITLGSEFEDTNFTPMHFNMDYEVWLKNRLLYQFQNRLNTVENNMHKLKDDTLRLAKQFLEQKNKIRKRFLAYDWTKLKGERIRVHGDYHLGQVLVTDNDFYILDFEGEPESTIRDRVVKQPPLKDVAGMFRSFHYAVYATIFNNGKKYPFLNEELFKAGECLYRYFIGVFLETYTNLIQDANLNIGYNQERVFMLKYSMLEKAVYELGYEMNARPMWAIIPLEGIASIMNEE
jgi:maltose alpha-D-glucosyltransferase/alpha-amylase